MDLPNFASIDLAELNNFVQKATPDEIESAISKMNTDQIKETVLQLDKGSDPKWKERTRAAILGLNTRPQLEAAANKLSVDQVIELLNKTLQVEDKHHWKLSPLLVGISFDVFAKLLSTASEEELLLIQHEGVTEPVQHQLTKMSHELNIQFEEIEKEIDTFYEEIERIDMEQINREDVLEMFHKIGLYSEFFERQFQKANKALAIAWNTNRPDLIEAFNKIKDSCHKYNVYGIGLPGKEETPSSGLYSRLEDKLFSVFGDPEDTADRDSLRDDEPAIEGLVKFSVWYLRDYWEMGLLPSIKSQKDLDLDLSKHSESERTRFREDLFAQAQENLEKIGLSTVSDLKKVFIFSKKTLQEYIQEQLLKT